MGQRHQAFLVARVVPSPGKASRYQCITALHDQWCYGSLPLRATLRFITLIKHPANAEVIREEMRAIESSSTNVEEHLRIPGPFAQFLFISAFGVSLDDPENPYAHGRVFNLEATMNPWDGGMPSSMLPQYAQLNADSTDNNDGLTIIDVTDPENVSCCFIDGDSAPNLNPITAEQYVSIYYKDSQERKPFEALIRSFDAIPVLSKTVIDEAWRRTDTDTVFSKTSQHDMALMQEIPSLVGLTLKSAVEQAIARNNIDALDFIFVDSARVAAVKEVIRSYNPVSDTAFALLRKLASVEKGDCETLDLSGYSLSRKQIVDILVLFSGSEVNLSHNADLKIDDLEEILQKTPHTVRRLLLFDTGITNSEIILLLDTKPKLFHRLESIVHPAFLSGFYEKEPVIPAPRFTHLMIGGFYAPWSASLPYFTPNTLAQGLTDYLSPIVVAKDLELMNYDLGFSLTARAAYAACSRADSQPWGERTVSTVPRSKYSKAMCLEKGEWLLVIAYDKIFYGMKPDLAYAFVRANKAGEDFLAGADSPESKAKLGLDVLFKPDLLDVFDIRGFFKELELEGRPAPEPKVLEKLFGLFPVDGDKTFAFSGYEVLMKKAKENFAHVR